VDDGSSEKQGLRASSFKPQVQDWLRVMVEAKENEKLNKLLFGILFVHTQLDRTKILFRTTTIAKHRRQNGVNVQATSLF
jgi:hypothetical protein